MEKIRKFFFGTSTIPFEAELIDVIKRGDLLMLKEYIEIKNIDPHLLTSVMPN